MRQDPFSEVLALAGERDDVVLSREARRLGLPKRELDYLRCASGQPLVRGAFAVPPVRNPARASVRAAQLVLPAGVVSHASAAHLHGLQGLGFWAPTDAVHLTLPAASTRHQRRGARLHFRELDDDDIVDLAGIRVTSVARTLADCAALTHRVAYIALVDSAINRQQFPVDQLEELAHALRRARCSEAAGWLRLVDGRAESPSETQVRVVLTDADLAPDELQLVVADESGWIVARLDMAYRRGGRRVGLEVDSAEHDRVRALYRDRLKHNALRAMHWDVRQVTAFDARRRPAYIVGQVRDALGML